MATVIRLRRGGRTHAPYYRIVVADSRKRPRGPVIEELGYYHPASPSEMKYKLDGPRALEWLKCGAKPSPTVRNLLSKEGILEAKATGRSLTPEKAPAAEETAPPEASAGAEETSGSES